MHSLFRTFRFILLIKAPASSKVLYSLRARNLLTISSERKRKIALTSPEVSCLNRRRSLVNTGNGLKFSANIFSFIKYRPVLGFGKRTDGLFVFVSLKFTNFPR